MVKINEKVQVSDGKSGKIPFCHVHPLTSEEPGFPKEVTNCYITTLDDRFAVFTASGVQKSFYKVYSEKDLHAKFQEQGI